MAAGPRPGTDRARRMLERSPELSPTLPSWIYRDPALLERERETVFRRGWCFVGHVSDTRSDMPAHGWIDNDLVLFRQDGDVLAADLVTCPGCAQAFANGPAHDAACPAHSSGSDDARRSVRIAVLVGLVFANLDDDAADLEALAPAMTDRLRGFLPRIEDLTLCHETRHEVAANWKVMIENSLECYHCEPCHPGFAGSMAMETYRSESDGILTVHSGMASDGVTPFRYWYLWPLTEIDATPGEQPQLSVFTRRTLGVERFAMIGRYYRLPGDRPDAAAIARMEGNATLREDIAICEAVQRGLASRGYDRGRFIVDPERSHISEHSVHHFQLLLGDALGLR